MAASAGVAIPSVRALSQRLTRTAPCFVAGVALNTVETEID